MKWYMRLSTNSYKILIVPLRQGQHCCREYACIIKTVKNWSVEQDFTLHLVYFQLPFIIKVDSDRRP